MKLVSTLSLSAALVLGGTTLVAQQPARQPAPRAPQAQAQRGQPGAQARRAQPPRDAMRRRRGAAARGALFRGIELSEAQRTQLREIDEQFRTEQRERMQAVRAERGEARVRPDSAERAQMRGQMQARLQQREARVRGVLTPEQRATFDANRARMAERMTERMATMRERRAERKGDGGRPPRARRGPRPDGGR